MKRKPRIGDSGELRFTVDSNNLMHFAEGGMPEVLSTPALIWFLENAARNALLPLFESGEACVGISVDIQHLAATPPGHEVVCRARSIHVDDRVVTFQVDAHDEHELIARGLHKRRIIDVARLAKRLATKANPPIDRPAQG